MESMCTWATELHIVIRSADEQRVIEEFSVGGRAGEVPIPRVGEDLSLVASDSTTQKVVNVTHIGHELIRRTNPWTWRSRWRITVRSSER